MSETAQTADIAVSPLVAQIISANASMLADTTNSLVDSLTAQVAELEARERAVRVGILGLLDGPYMPTPDAIRRALYPSESLVDHCRQQVQS